MPDVDLELGILDHEPIEFNLLFVILNIATFLIKYQFLLDFGNFTFIFLDYSILQLIVCNFTSLNATDQILRSLFKLLILG
jgi:hypothetical protein